MLTLSWIGPSGHGKSLLARKCEFICLLGIDLRSNILFVVGSLLDVPTHTVNMTTLKSTHDLWQSYSMSPYEVTMKLMVTKPYTDGVLDTDYLHLGRVSH